MINKAYDKVTKDEVEENLSSHAIYNHLNVSLDDIKRRFIDGMIKTENGYTYDNTHPVYISWWNSRKIMLICITAALNADNNKKKIKDWLKNWSKDEGYTYTLTCKTSVDVGSFVYKNGNWNKAIPVPVYKVVLQLEPCGNVENAGFSIKTAYPYPTPEDEDKIISHKSHK